jgi:TRAP-type mannitol/chloroaromatic compound transport system permease large subunit
MRNKILKLFETPYLIIIYPTFLGILEILGIKTTNFEIITMILLCTAFLSEKIDKRDSEKWDK